MSSYLPVKRLNIPNGGNQGSDLSVPDNEPTYSSYTGNLIGYGNIPRGTTCDAPEGHANFGKDFHVVEYNEANNSYMAHQRR